MCCRTVRTRRCQGRWRGRAQWTEGGHGRESELDHACNEGYLKDFSRVAEVGVVSE